MDDVNGRAEAVLPLVTEDQTSGVNKNSLLNHDVSVVEIKEKIC